MSTEMTIIMIFIVFVWPLWLVTIGDKRSREKTRRFNESYWTPEEKVKLGLNPDGTKIK